LNYAEEEARGTFQSGYAVFMRNWPYAWGLVNMEGSRIKGLVGMTHLPSADVDKPGASTLGGWGLAVSKYTNHPKEAVDLLRYLTSVSEQKKRALAAGLFPSYPELYHDPDLIKKIPHLDEMEVVLRNAVSRPAYLESVNYNKLSFEIWESIWDILSQKTTASQGVSILSEKLKKMIPQKEESK
ncbi:MAG: extracellular solute-binding protein, partial [Bdellovibrionales bacterium]|nr:extracellular solute-binding protein [Bdellovibrionales bacterium]